MSEVIYLATFEYGRPNIIRVVVKRRTQKTIIVESAETLLGWMYVGESIRLIGSRIFAELKDALEWCHEMSRQNSISIKEKLEKAEKTTAELAELIDLCDRKE